MAKLKTAKKKASKKNKPQEVVNDETQEVKPLAEEKSELEKEQILANNISTGKA